MRKSWGMVAALSAVALAIPAAALAADPPATTTTPAGDGSANAVAAQVDGVVSAGETKARSGPNDADATGNAVTLGGTPPSKEFGGSVKSDGDADDHGSLLDTDSTPLGRVQVTPWEAHTKKAGADGCRTAQGRAAVARVTLIDKSVADVNVLQSQSDASHCGLKSTGKGSSDGAHAMIGGEGGLVLTLLHSEAATDDNGKTYLISINGNEIANNEQADGGCSLDVPGLLGLTCLTVGGGEGTVFADVADATLGDGALTAKLVGTTSSPDKSGGAASVLPETIEPAPAAAPSTVGRLARTGLDLGAFAALGLVAIALGEAVRRRNTAM
jgi:hypothetical protein